MFSPFLPMSYPHFWRAEVCVGVGLSHYRKFRFTVGKYLLAWCNEHDISLSPAAEARDTTELLNDASYQFRATLELEMPYALR